MASMPALAQASSASPPGAPDTPTAPTSTPPDSTISPPPIMTAPGRLRIPACIMPGWLMANRPLVLLRKVAAVQALPEAVAGVCGRRSDRAVPPGSRRRGRRPRPQPDSRVAGSQRARPGQGPVQSWEPGICRSPMLPARVFERRPQEHRLIISRLNIERSWLDPRLSVRMTPMLDFLEQTTNRRPLFAHDDH